jgi:hypothetical protein
VSSLSISYPTLMQGYLGNHFSVHISISINWYMKVNGSGSRHPPHQRPSVHLFTHISSSAMSEYECSSVIPMRRQYPQDEEDALLSGPRKKPYVHSEAKISLYLWIVVNLLRQVPYRPAHSPRAPFWSSRTCFVQPTYLTEKWDTPPASSSASG